MEWFSEETEHELHELRCLHELARQLLPLSDRDEIARDGLLCIAGITGIGTGAVLWRDADGLFALLSHFGFRLMESPTHTVSMEAEKFLLGAGASSLQTCRDHPAGRTLLGALGSLSTEVSDAWVLPLIHDARLAGVLILGPSLVTGEVLKESAWLTDLADTLRLALVGTAGLAGAAPVRPVSDSVASAQSPPLASRGLAALRERYPETQELVGESASIVGVLEEIVTLAETDYTVMVHGRTGTGKELAASLLHRLSRRHAGPFEAVDCSAIPRELIESELFGHVKGAFTGALRDFKGAFERAHGGTLLLDEIGDMDLRSQTRLLRVLQEGKVRPVGGDRPVSVDVRVVAATNRDLAEMVRTGTFREDLYYRIHVCLLSIPALKDRGEDRVVLFDHFMGIHAGELGQEARQLSSQGRERLMREDFPGNVRQLQNVVRQLLVQRVEDGQVGANELERVLSRSTLTQNPAPIAPAAAVDDPSIPVAGDVRETVGDIGNWVVDQLRNNRFNISAAAKELAERRISGQGRESIPVFDRGALDYYLCGEFYERLLQFDFDVQAVIVDLAADAALEARVLRKVQAFLRPLKAVSHLDYQKTDTAAIVQEAFARVPERYQPSLHAVVLAILEERWAP